MNWPLNVDNFTLLDRLKICSFILNKNNKWTQADRVKAFEQNMAKYVGCNYAVFCSSGSTANTMLAMRLRDTVEKEKRIVVFPSTTWITSVAPFIREGFTPHFIDINLDDLCFDYDKLQSFLELNHESVACIFPTSLLGFVPDIQRLSKICFDNSVKLMFDNCENTLGTYKNKNICSFYTSTTSTYFGHQIQSVEGGFVFTDYQSEYDYFLTLRNHGMTRSVEKPSLYSNPKVDSRFDFYCLGNNFRGSDINAFIGNLDLNKVNSHFYNRTRLYEYYQESLNQSKFILPKDFADRTHVAFCLPVIFRDASKKQKALDGCSKMGIETRPIISGNLLRQTCLKKYDDYTSFPNSELLHNNGFYVGLHTQLTHENIIQLTSYLNNL